MKKINLGSIFESLIQGKKEEADNLFHKYTIAEGAKINAQILSEDESVEDELKNETSITIDLAESEANPDELNSIFDEIMEELGIEADVIFDEEDQKYTLTFDSEEEADTFTDELSDRITARDIDQVEVCGDEEEEEELDEASHDEWLEEPYYRAGDRETEVESVLEDGVANFHAPDFLSEYSHDLGLDNIGDERAEPEDYTVSKQEIMDALNHYFAVQVSDALDIELDEDATNSAAEAVYDKAVAGIKELGGIVSDDSLTEDEIGDNQSPIDIARRMGYDAAKNGDTRKFNSNLRSLMNDHPGDAQREDIHKAFISGMDDYKSGKHVDEGKDLGKPGKNFAKIAKSAGKEYGSKEAGERVAGAVLKNLRKEHPRKYSESAITEDEITSKNSWQYLDSILKRINQLEGIGLDNMTADEENEYDKLSKIYSEFKRNRDNKITEDEIGDNQSPIDAARRMGYDAAKDGNENKFNSELRALMNDKAGDAQREDIHKAYIEGMDEYHNESKVTESDEHDFSDSKGKFVITFTDAITNSRNFKRDPNVLKVEANLQVYGYTDRKWVGKKLEVNIPDNKSEYEYHIKKSFKDLPGVSDIEIIDSNTNEELENATIVIVADNGSISNILEILDQHADYISDISECGEQEDTSEITADIDPDYVEFVKKQIWKIDGVHDISDSFSTIDEDEDEDCISSDVDTVEDESEDDKLDLILAKISELEAQISNVDSDETGEEEEEEEELPEGGEEYDDLSEDYRLEPVKTEPNVDGEMVGADKKKNKQQEESPMSKVEGIDLAIKRDGIQSPSKDNARGYEWKNIPKVDKSKLKGDVKNAEQKLEKVNKDDKKALINKSQGKPNDESVLGNGTIAESSKKVLRTRR